MLSTLAGPIIRTVRYAWYEVAVLSVVINLRIARPDRTTGNKVMCTRI